MGEKRRKEGEETGILDDICRPYGGKIS